MNHDEGFYRRDDGFEGRYRSRERVKVLMREPESCRICGRRFLSLYPILNCAEHDGLDELLN